MNFYDAVSSHLTWKQQLRDYVDGHPSHYWEREDVAREDGCELGRWIAANHAALGHLPEFLRLRELHADVHRCAGEVVGLANRGAIAEAVAAMQGEFGHVSALLVKSLTRLNKTLADGSASSAAA